MANELTLSQVTGNKQQFNLALAFEQERQHPFYRTSVSLVPIDTSANSAEIFKVASKGKNNPVDTYALTKPALMKLATEAGIQFNPDANRIERIDENTWKATACGGIQLPDGKVRTATDTKVIDLISEERKYRNSYRQEVQTGITAEWKINKVSQKYRGQFDGTRFMFDPSEKERYIEEQTNEAMSQLRANAPQKATTGANLRVIRALLGIHGTYTMEELRKPFVVARAVLAPDYSDPVIKQTMLLQAMQSSNNLFGALPQIQMQPVPQPQPMPQVMYKPSAENVPEFDVDVEPELIDSNEMQYQKPEVVTLPQQKPVDCRYNNQPAPAPAPAPEPIQCADCGESINERVLSYSKQRYGRPLCMTCQKKAANPYNNR